MHRTVYHHSSVQSNFNIVSRDFAHDYTVLIFHIISCEVFQKLGGWLEKAM